MGRLNLKELQLKIPVLDLLETRKLIGGNTYGEAILDIDGGKIEDVTVIGNRDEYEDFHDYDRDNQHDGPDLDNEFDNNGSEDGKQGDEKGVPDGDCVIGTIQEVAKILGTTIDSEAIIKAAPNYTEGKGIKLNTQQFFSLASNFFDCKLSSMPAEAKVALENGKTVIARMHNPESGDNGDYHAIVLEGADAVEVDYNGMRGLGYEFDYYDPVNGTHDNDAPYDWVRDFIIIDGIR